MEGTRVEYGNHDHSTMSKKKSTSRGTPADVTIYTDGVDPMIVKLRTEQVRQGLSNYALSIATGIGPDRLGKLWKGESEPNFKVVRKIIDALRARNPKFKVTDP